MPRVDSHTLHGAVSPGVKSYSRPALPESAQRDLPGPRDTQSSNSPDMAGGAGNPGNTDSDRERRLERISREEDVAWNSWMWYARATLGIPYSLR